MIVPACPGSAPCEVRLTDVSEEVEYFFRFEVYYGGENRAALPPLASGSFIVVSQPTDPDQNRAQAREGGDRLRKFPEYTRLDIYGYLDRDYDGEESSGDLAASVLGVKVDGRTIDISYLDLQPVP